RIIGSQPPTLELSGSAAENRFNLIFQKFIQLFTQKEHPLVIFLDDLQWADSASLKLIQLLMSDTNQGYLLLIGAYRDNEVSPTHPLILKLDKIKNIGAVINTITLRPLSQIKLNQLVVDTLKCSEDNGFPLSQLIHRKTEGNPFFATQFLKSLHQDKLIEFNFAEGCWQCDISQINQQALTDNVVEFMVFQLQRLPQSTQEVLKLAACIGNQFDLETLAIVSQQSQVETAACLWNALQEGFVLPQSEVYKFFVCEANQLENQENSQAVTYKFLHDRIQQAAYALIPETQKENVHYQIGQSLLQKVSSSVREERIFELVNQLNYGINLIVAQTERDELAQLNLIASRRARAATAYKAGHEYAKIGLQLLGKEAWQRQYQSTLTLHELVAETASLLGDFQEMSQWIDATIASTTTSLDCMGVYQVKIQALNSRAQFGEAIATGRSILQLLGVSFPDFPTREDIEQVRQEINSAIGDRSIEDLIHLPKMTDVHKLAIVQIASSITPACYLTGSPLYPLVVALQVKLSIQHGNNLFSPFSYASYAAIVNSFSEQITEVQQFGQLAYQLALEPEAKNTRVATYILIGGYIHHRTEHLRETLPILQEGYQAGLETGNLEFLIYTLQVFALNAFWCGQTLSELEPQIRAYHQHLQDINQVTTGKHYLIYWEMARILLGESEDEFPLRRDVYEEELLAQIKVSNDAFRLGTFYLHRFVLNFLLGDIEQSQKDAVQAQHHLVAYAGTIIEPGFYFYDSLTTLATLSESPEKWQRVQENQTQLQRWAGYAPMNHQHKLDLVEAEKCRVFGKNTEAIELYDKAIAGAKANKYIQEEALGNELAAKFYLGWGKERVAAGYMQEAYYCYSRWGAKAKTDDLEKRYPQLLKPIREQRRLTLNPWETITTIAFPQTSDSTHTSTASSTNISQLLDFSSILKAAQAISSSIELDQLLTNLTKIILESSGAKKSVLILPQEDIWEVRAITFINYQNNYQNNYQHNYQSEIQTILTPQSLETCEDVPKKIINYVKNTQETIFIDNCQTHIPGIIGEYILTHQPKSVLCKPIINQGHLVGILYLENQLTCGVFTQERLQVINLLSSQAAISLENAQLYKNSQNYAQQLQNSLTKLQEHETRFQNLTNNIPGMVYQFYLGTDGSTSTPYVSSGCRDLYELEPELVMQGKHSLYAMHHPDDHPGMAQAVADSAQNLTPFEQEWRIVLPSGKVKWVQSAARPTRLADGGILWDGVVIDISDRKQAEAAVNQKSQELEQALQNLQQAQLQIVQSEKMSALGNLVAGVAHEMNNPLGFISASLKQAKPTVADITEHLKLYQENIPNPSEEIIDHADEIDLDYSLEDLPKMIDAMGMACDRLKNISTSLRTFSRADQDYKVPFNIHEGIDSTILILKHRLKANELRPAIEVVTEYGNLPQVECFPGQLNQVFMNILANAIDALDDSNSGRSFEEIKANPNKITIKTSVQNDKVKITITDNGKGMNESVQQKIFDHLFTTKGVGKGTGLGLAIARQIIEETHGGKLSCNSILGIGTEFILELPL
ncbi:ATP-binding protein, partial [Calothrix sp. UHCC 0171]|uniref:ATP-binding sensor histidine kinase n=1 Tax=Calothrix sp. UHCC 0171 TaxID=3110245 RepID=UPI002B2165C8